MKTRTFVDLQDQRKQRSLISGDAESPQGQKQLEQHLRTSAKARAQQGDYSSAIVMLTQLIDCNPTSAADYNNRGLLYFQNGQLEKAIADYNTALQLNPHLASVYNNRANYYAQLGKLEAAIADYEMALDLNPGNIRAWINQGITFRDLELYEQAVENFDFALRSGQLTGNIYAERGRTYHLWGDWNCAISDYQRALTYLPLPSQPVADPAVRLRLQVEIWIKDLVHPIAHSN